MFKTNLSRLSKTSSAVVILSLLGFTCLTSCGPAITGQSALAENNEMIPPPATELQVNFEQLLDGTWTRPCDPAKNSMEEIVSFNNGKFTREYIGYTNNCKDKGERFRVTGSYVLGSAATNVLELTFERGNFALKPADNQSARNIDFTIDEWEFEFKNPAQNQDRVDLNAMVAECPSVQIEEGVKILKVRRNGCELTQLKNKLFDIISLQKNHLSLGLYINDLNSFDPAGGTSPELRNNVVSNLPLNRLRSGK